MNGPTPFTAALGAELIVVLSCLIGAAMIERGFAVLEYLF
jgi:hypothetical protein